MNLLRNNRLDMDRAVAMANRIHCGEELMKHRVKKRVVRHNNDIVEELIEKSLKDTKRENLTRIFSAYLTLYNKERPDITRGIRQVYNGEMRRLEAAESKSATPHYKTVDLRRMIRTQKQHHTPRRILKSHQSELRPRSVERTLSNAKQRVAVRKVLNERSYSVARKEMEKKLDRKQEDASHNRERFLRTVKSENHFDHVSRR